MQCLLRIKYSAGQKSGQTLVSGSLHHVFFGQQSNNIAGLDSAKERIENQRVLTVEKRSLYFSTVLVRMHISPRITRLQNSFQINGNISSLRYIIDR